jgi:predicted nucleotidyltransferase
MQSKQPDLRLPDARMTAFKREVARALPGAVQAVILFGSRARGDATPASDYDVAVLLNDHLADDRDIRRRVADVAWDCDTGDGMIQVVPLNAEALTPPRTELAWRIAAEGVLI